MQEFGGKWDAAPADVEPADLNRPDLMFYTGQSGPYVVPPPDDLSHYVKEFPKSPAALILERAASLIDGDRNKQHGDRKECHTAIAALWSAYLAVNIKPTDVALMMALLKIARTQTGAKNEEPFVDGAGYIALAGELSNDQGC